MAWRKQETWLDEDLRLCKVRCGCAAPEPDEAGSGKTWLTEASMSSELGLICSEFRRIWPQNTKQKETDYEFRIHSEVKLNKMLIKTSKEGSVGQERWLSG